jgi:hypothetical protein
LALVDTGGFLSTANERRQTPLPAQKLTGLRSISRQKEEERRGQESEFRIQESGAGANLAAPEILNSEF